MYMRNRCVDSKMNNEMPNYECSKRDDMMCMGGIKCPPIYECPTERVCHREFVHEVPHICPCNTKIINHHIYRHTFSPCYTCCEENEVCNVYDGCCNQF